MHNSKAHLPRGQPAGQGLSTGVFSQGHAQASPGTRSHSCTTTSSTILSLCRSPESNQTLMSWLCPVAAVVSSSFGATFTFSGTAL